MEYSKRKKNTRGRESAQKRDRRGKPQRSEKARKGGRGQKQPISGFSTLSQVAGVPLRRSYHSNIPVPNPLTLAEPLPVCPECGERVNSIAESFIRPDGVLHFDCMLSRIRAGETLGENDTVSYLGSGAFGVCHLNDDGTYTILKRIEVETKEEISNMKSYVDGLKV